MVLSSCIFFSSFHFFHHLFQTVSPLPTQKVTWLSEFSCMDVTAQTQDQCWCWAITATPWWKALPLRWACRYFNGGRVCPQKVGYCWPTIFSAFSIFEEQKQISSWSEALAVSHKRSNYSSAICLNVWRLGSGSNTSAENFAWVWYMLWFLRTQDKSSWVSIDRVDNWESLLNTYHCFNEVDDIGSEDQWSYL